MKTLSDLVGKFPVFQGVIDGLNGEVDFLVGIDGGVLDRLLVREFGDRLLISKVEDDPEYYIDSISWLVMDKWRSLGSVWKYKTDLTSNGDNEVIVKSKENEDKTFKGDDINKVASFNEGDLIDDTGRVSDNKEDRKADSERVTVVKNQSLGLTVKNLQLSSNFNIIKGMLKDVSEQLTISIY